MFGEDERDVDMTPGVKYNNIAVRYNVTLHGVKTIETLSNLGRAKKTRTARWSGLGTVEQGRGTG